MQSDRHLTAQLWAGGLALLLAGAWLLQTTLPPRDVQPRVVRKAARSLPRTQKRSASAPTPLGFALAGTFDGWHVSAAD